MKKFVVSLLIMVSFLVGCSKLVKDGYVENKEMTLTFSYGERTGIYTGEIEDGIPEGTGTFQSVNDENETWEYTGEWQQGTMNGTGICEWENGTKYEGEYKAGLMDGEGSLYQDGELLNTGTFSEGRLLAISREKVEIAEDTPRQYVKVGKIGFQIPQAWSYNVADNNTVYVNIPDNESVGIVLGISTDMDISDEQIREALKNQYLIDYGTDYPEYRLVSENYKSGMSPEFDLHFTFYAEDMLADVYSYSFSRSSGTYTLTIVQAGGGYDYSEAALCIKDTMKNWDAIQTDIENQEKENVNQSIMQLLNGDIDWTGIEDLAPKMTGQDIVDYTYKKQIVLVEGIIDNISEETFDVWIPHDGSYMKTEDWNYGIELGNISQGSTVQICIETHSDGSLKKSEGILAIRELDVPVVTDIVSEFKRTCKNLDYSSIMRNPESARGSIWRATGTVFQVVETESYLQEMLLELKDGNIVYVAYYKDENADNILEGDKVDVYGTFYQTETYTTLLGESKTVPRLTVDYVDIR